MKSVALLLSAIMFAGCASSHVATAEINREPTTAQAISLARREIQKRGLPLPKNHTVDVSESQSFQELRRTRPIYVVTFRALSEGKTKRLYYVHIDRDSGQISDVIDLRGAVPAGS